jgi:hypothetical protein
VDGIEEPSFAEIEDGSLLDKPVLLGELPRFHNQERKRCMLVSVELDADFSKGCASRKAITYFSPPPLPLDSRIDSQRYAPAVLGEHHGG